MPFQDVIQSRFTAAEQTQYNTIVSQMEALILPKLRKMEEYGVIDEQKKNLINKMRESLAVLVMEKTTNKN